MSKKRNILCLKSKKKQSMTPMSASEMSLAHHTNSSMGNEFFYQNDNLTIEIPLFESKKVGTMVDFHLNSFGMAWRRFEICWHTKLGTPIHKLKLDFF